MIQTSCTCGHDGSQASRIRCIDFDDNRFLEEELKPDSSSWRKEKYAKRSHVKIFDHDRGRYRCGSYDDQGIEELLVSSPVKIPTVNTKNLSAQATATSQIHFIADNPTRTVTSLYGPQKDTETGSISKE